MNHLLGQVHLKDFTRFKVELEGALWVRCLEVFPGSKRVELGGALAWISHSEDKAQMRLEAWAELFDGVDADELHRMKTRRWNEMVRDHHDAVQHQLLACLQYPAGVFYEYGEYRGFRYGFEASEYLSGFEGGL